jgi:hypothetical protein
MLVVFYFPELCVFCNHAVIRHLNLFVLVRYYNYLFLTASFSCTLSYMQHEYYQLVVFYFPDLCIFCNHAVVQHLTLFVWVRYYNYLFLFYSIHIRVRWRSTLDSTHHSITCNAGK